MILPGLSAMGSMPALVAYDYVQKQGDQQVEALRNSPTLKSEISYFTQRLPVATETPAIDLSDDFRVKREISYFRSKLPLIQNVDDFLADERLVSFAMTAYGLADKTDKTQYVEDGELKTKFDKQFLIDMVFKDSQLDGTSPVKALGPNWQALNKDMNFSDYGTNRIRDRDFVVGLIDKYVGAKNDAATEAANADKRQSYITLERFSSDSRLMRFAMVAAGLGSETDKIGLAQRILREDPENPKSAVKQLDDARWTAFREMFDFGSKGRIALPINASVIDQYVEGVRNAEIEEQNPALSAAMFLKEQGTTVKNTFQILASPTLREVFTVTFNLPREMALQSVETQAGYIDRAFDIAKLQDPKELDKLIQRFLLASDSGTQTVDSSGGLLNLFA